MSLNRRHRFSELKLVSSKCLVQGLSVGGTCLLYRILARYLLTAHYPSSFFAHLPVSLSVSRRYE